MYSFFFLVCLLTTTNEMKLSKPKFQSYQARIRPISLSGKEPCNNVDDRNAEHAAKKTGRKEKGKKKTKYRTRFFLILHPPTP